MAAIYWEHVDLTAQTDAPLADSVPGAYPFEAEKQQHVVYAGQDRHLHLLSVSAGQTVWAHVDLTAEAGAPAPAGTRISGYAFEAEKRQHIVYAGTDYHIHEIALSIGQAAWGHFDLTAATGTPLSYGDPYGYAFEAENRQHVVFKGADNHLWELGISIGQTAWGHFDLTAETGAPPELAEPGSGYGFDAEQRQHVYWKGQDGHLLELAISVGQNGWGWFDLTAGTGAPPVRDLTVPFGYKFEAERRQHLIYFGADGHLHELAISVGQTAWGHYDLTAATGAPPPAPTTANALLPAGFAFESEKRQHVAYVGADGHIHELTNILGENSWYHEDVTARTDAPEPLSTLVGYAFEAEGRQHLVYTGTDRHVHDLSLGAL